MNMQLVRDFGKLLNDGRIGFCDVRPSKQLGGILIGSIVFEYGGSKYSVIARDVHVTYDNIIECVIDVYSSHPTRTVDDLLFAYNYDNAKKQNSLAVTNSSNLELYGVRRTTVSAALTRVLKEYVMRHANIISKDTYRYMNTASVGANILFKIA